MTDKNKKPSLCRLTAVTFAVLLVTVCGGVVLADSMERAPAERVVAASSDPMP